MDGAIVLKPKISIYTPTYNRSDLLLERAVKSVLQQDFQDWDYWIIGDCCTDDTEKRLMKLGDNRIKFVNLSQRVKAYPPTAENHWLAAPVQPANKALELVTGEWIARIDDDEMWTDDHLRKALAFAIEGDYEFVSADNFEVRAEIAKKAKIHYAHSKYYGYPEDDKTSPMIGSTSTWLYKNELKRFKYDPECYKKEINRVNDIDLVQRMYKAGVKMGFVNDIHCWTIPRPGEKEVGYKAYVEDAKNKEAFYRLEAMYG